MKFLVFAILTGVTAMSWAFLAFLQFGRGRSSIWLLSAAAACLFALASGSHFMRWFRESRQ